MESSIHMRRILKLSLACLAAGAVTACDPDTVVQTEAIPTAGVRFINAVPDTGAMDLRFVDLVESNAHWQQNFRNGIIISPTGASGIPASTTIQYKGARAGSRHFKIFMNGGCDETHCDQSYASTVVQDATVDLVAGHNYTVLLMGYTNATRQITTVDDNVDPPVVTTSTPAGLPASPPALQMVIIDETHDPGTQIGLRAINTTANAIDVFVRPSPGSFSATPTWDALAPMTASAHQDFAPGTYVYRVQNDGSATTLFADRIALQGQAAVTEAPGPFDARPGTLVAGSNVTAIIWPRSVEGSPAPQTDATSSAPSFLTPAISFVWDKRPPRPDGV